MVRKLTLILALLVTLAVITLLVDNRRQGRLIRERYAQLTIALQARDTNAIRSFVVGNVTPTYLDPVVLLPWHATETPGVALIMGSSALFWPHGKGQRGFPEGDVLQWVSSNGVWYVSDRPLD